MNTSDPRTGDPTLPLGREKILVVDDDHDVRREVVAQLTNLDTG
jgi:hypothetical protein